MNGIKLKNPPAPPLLPVSSMDRKRLLAPSTPQDKRKKPPPPPPPRFPALHAVSWWALSTACAFAIFAAYITSLPTSCAADGWAPAWWWCRELAAAAADQARAVLPRFMCCAALQVAAAAPALVLPGRVHVRWALALVAYAASASNHFRFATLIGLIMDGPAVDILGLLWVVAGGVYLFRLAPAFAMLSFAALGMEYFEEYHAWWHDV